MKYEKYGTLYINVEILTVQDSFKNFKIFKTILDTRDISISQKTLKINKKGLKWPKKVYDQLSGVRSTQKLVKIHNSCM